MSLLLGLTGSQLGHVVPELELPTSTYVELLESIAGGPTGHWRMDEVSGSVMTDRGGNDGSYVGSPGLGFAPLVENPDGGGSARFGTGSDHATILNPVTQASFTLDLAVQFDVVKSKHVVFHRGAGSEAGDYSLEAIDDGAGGLKPRMFSADATGDAVVYVGTNPGTIPVGPAAKLTYQRDASDGSQRCFVDGIEIAMTLDSGAQPASWPAPPSNDDFHLASFRGSFDPLDGLMAELAAWDGTVLSGADIAKMAVAQSAADLDNFDAGTALTDASTNITLAPHALPETGFTPSVVSQGSLGTASVDGEGIEYTAGSTPGSDSFQVEIDNHGTVSRTATITIEVVESGGGGADAPTESSDTLSARASGSAPGESDAIHPRGSGSTPSESGDDLHPRG